MKDWKDALASLAGSDATPETASTTSDIARKKRSGVVYSTDPDYAYSSDDDAITEQLPKNLQKLRVSVERAGRGGKTVTLVKDFSGPDSDLEDLCRLLKQKCGVGGSAKDGELIIQGDHRQRIIDILKSEGFSQTK